MRLKYFRATSTALCALTLACSESAPAPSDPRPVPPAEFSLTGRVSDVNTGAPLNGTTLTVVDGTNVGRLTTSEADGSYSLVLKPGGFTMRARHDGYDSFFQGVTFVANTFVDIQMRPAMQTLAGRWAGTLSLVQASTGILTEVAIPQLAMGHAGFNISSTFQTSGPYGGSFSGTLRDDSSIASTTETEGTMTVTYNLAGRNPMTCRGTSRFTGTVNWTSATMTALPVDLECGMKLTAVTITLERQQ
jgi:Carboxypeptidase regulatory-like domain